MASPPSRAAWIEIACGILKISITLCRRLHGRRGLKFANFTDDFIRGLVAAFTGGVD